MLHSRVTALAIASILGAMAGLNPAALAQDGALPDEHAKPDGGLSPTQTTSFANTIPSPQPLTPAALDGPGAGQALAPQPEVPVDAEAETEPSPRELMAAVGIDTSKSFDWANVNLEELLNLPVTSASKEKERASEAPSSVTVFTRADMARLGITTVEQLLNFVPGFQGTTDNGNGIFRVSARGRSTIAHEFVLVLVDGQRVNDPYTGGSMSSIAVENVQQIEIIRGPGSALYGANAFLGVIDIKTVRGASGVTAGAGNLNSRYAAANLGKSIGDLKLSSFARYYADEGYRFSDVTDIMGRSVTAYDPSQQVDLSLALEYKGFTLSTRYMERSFEGLSCCNSYSQYSDRTDSTQSSMRGGYHRELSDRLVVDAGASISRDQRLTISTQSPVGAIPDPRSSIVLAETYILGKKWLGYTGSSYLDLGWRALSKSWVKGTLLVGGSYDYVNVPETSDISSHDVNWVYQGEIYEFRHPGIVRNAAAGYIQAKADLWSKFLVTTGVRYDWYSDFGSAVSPRAALVYTTPLRSSVKLMYGRAFRAPSFMELYDRPLRVAPSSTTKLNAETIETIEVGYTQQILDYAQGTLTYFHNRLDNIIQPPQGVLPYRNFGDSTMEGIELDIRTREIFGFHLLGSYTHLIPSAEEKDTLLVPLDFGSAALTYSWNRLIVNLNSILRGPSKIGGQAVAGVVGTLVTYDQPGYALVNAHVQLKLLPELRLFALAKNIFGHQTLQSGGTPLPAGLLTRGRTFILGVGADL
jgi:outer membrane receptor for ferrienterochelin and colicins